MPLIRKTRLSGSSILLAIPSQFAEAYDINEGDEIEIIPLSKKELMIRKAYATQAHQNGTPTMKPFELDNKCTIRRIPKGRKTK